MSKRLVLALPLALGLALAACAWIDPKPPHFEVTAAQAGPFDGQVSAIHPDVNTVSTERKTSKGMEYFTVEVRPATDLRKLHIGDRIEGRVVAEPHNVYATDIRIIR
jgi:hypothetical protein